MHQLSSTLYSQSSTSAIPTQFRRRRWAGILGDDLEEGEEPAAEEELSLSSELAKLTVDARTPLATTPAHLHGIPAPLSGALPRAPSRETILP